MFLWVFLHYKIFLIIYNLKEPEKNMKEKKAIYS